MHFNLYFCHRIRPQIHFVISSFTSKKRNPETHDTHHLINLIYTMNKTDLVNAIAAAGLSKAATKEKIEIPAKKVIKFKAGAELAEAVK